MTKTELMETYTAEQLAEMVAELQNGKENKVFKVKDNKNYQKEIDDFFRNSVDKICNDILEQKNNAMAIEFTRIIGELLRKKTEYTFVLIKLKLEKTYTTISLKENMGLHLIVWIFHSMTRNLQTKSKNCNPKSRNTAKPLNTQRKSVTARLRSTRRRLRN